MLAWLLFSFANANFEPGDAGATKTGKVLGAGVVPLVVAIVVRLLYVHVLRRRDSLPFWSPWVFAMAAVLGLFLTAADARERGGEQSASDVAVCSKAAMQEYEAASSAEKAAFRDAGFTRDKLKTLFSRACKRADEQGLMDEEYDPEKMRPIVEDVVADMRANGELPSGS